MLQPRIALNPLRFSNPRFGGSTRTAYLRVDRDRGLRRRRGDDAFSISLSTCPF